MVINSAKTKEMIMGRIDVSDLPPLCTKTGQIQRVHSFKLLGVYVDESLTWNCRIQYITAKASKHLNFLKVLKRSGLANNSLMNFFANVRYMSSSVRLSSVCLSVVCNVRAPYSSD